MYLTVAIQAIEALGDPNRRDFANLTFFVRIMNSSFTADPSTMPSTNVSARLIPPSPVRAAPRRSSGWWASLAASWLRIRGSDAATRQLPSDRAGSDLNAEELRQVDADLHLWVRARSNDASGAASGDRSGSAV